MDQIYGLTAISMMAIIFLVVFYSLHLVRTAQAQTDALIHNIMPDEIAERLKEHPGRTIAESYDAASVIAARLQTAGHPGRCHISAATRKQLPEPCRATGPRTVLLKGIGPVQTCTIDAE